MENYALQLSGKTIEAHDSGSTEKATRIKILVSIAAAFAVNCSSNLETRIAAARVSGITKPT